MSWSDLSDWWANELAGDAAYESVVTLLLFEVFFPVLGDPSLELGVVEGRVMRSMSDLGVSVVGVDLSEDLAAKAGHVLRSWRGKKGSLSYAHLW